MQNIKIAPSLLSADFSNILDDVYSIKNASYIHFDIMDNHFVPNLTFGTKFIKDLRQHSNQVFDVHLMVENPDLYIAELVKAGADIITIHYEASLHIDRSLSLIKSYNKKAGLALNPGTSEGVLKYLLSKLDQILVMTVNPGFGGQKFLYDQVQKISEVKRLIENYNKDIDIEVDGGINPETAKIAVKAGANILVAGSYIFNQADREKAIQELTSGVQSL